MEDLFSRLKDIVQSQQVVAVVKAAVILLIGLLFYGLIRRRLRLRRMAAQQGMIIKKVLGVLVLAVTAIWVLRELGLDISVLLGAAGILTVAIGFASQTSASNLISGVFLMAERPFQVGDIISIGQNTGEVLEIGFMSVRLRTFDNLLVRIPNENMLKSAVTNLTCFPIRRVDMKIGVAYKEDLQRVREILFRVAEEEPLCLDEPGPLALFLGFGDSALELQFSVWAAQKNFFALRNNMWLEIKAAFDRAGVEIPFPHLSLYPGSQADPLAVELVRAVEAPERVEAAS